MAPVKEGKQISDYELQHIKNVTENHRMWETMRQNVISQEKKFDSLQPTIIPLKKRKPAETREVKKPRLETEGQYKGSIVNDGIRKSTRISGKAKAQVRSNGVVDGDKDDKDDKDDEAVYDVEDSEEECDGENSAAKYEDVNYEAGQKKMMFNVEEDEGDGEGRKRKRGRELQNKIIKPRNRPNFYGAVPGVEIGRIWKTRLECSRDGIMRPNMAGIHAGPEGAYSIVLSGVYEDNMDHGDSFIYTGEGGRAKQNGARRNGQTIKDQTLTKGNLALSLNIETKKPVRVIRGYKDAHTKYTPKFGYRYDGLYTVEKYWLCVGKDGFNVFKFALSRCHNQAPPPWRPLPMGGPMGGPMSGMGGPVDRSMIGQSPQQQQLLPPQQQQPIKQQPGNSTMEAQYMHQQSQIFVFSDNLANKAAESVHQGQFQTIIDFHCSQPGTKKILVKYPPKNPNNRNPPNWMQQQQQQMHQKPKPMQQQQPGGPNPYCQPNMPMKGIGGHFGTGPGPGPGPGMSPNPGIGGPGGMSGPGDFNQMGGWNPGNEPMMSNMSMPMSIPGPPGTQQGNMGPYGQMGNAPGGPGGPGGMMQQQQCCPTGPGGPNHPTGMVPCGPASGGGPVPCSSAGPMGNPGVDSDQESSKEEDDEDWSAGNSQHSLSGISASCSYGAMTSAHETANEAWTDLEEKLQRLQDEKRELSPPLNAKGHFAAYFLKKHGLGDTQSLIYNDILEEYWNLLEEDSIRRFVYLQTVSEKEYEKTQKDYDLKIVKTTRECDRLLFDKKYSAILQRIGSSEVKYKCFQLDMDEITIGRAKENCFVIEDVLISRKHAIFRLDNGKWTVESVGMNGIAVNNSIVTKNQQTPIYHMDVIDFNGVSKRYLYTFLLQSSSSDYLPGDLNSNKSQSHKSDRQEKTSREGNRNQQKDREKRRKLEKREEFQLKNKCHHSKSEHKDEDDRKKSSHRDEERDRSHSVILEQSISPLPTLHPKTYLKSTLEVEVDTDMEKAIVHSGGRVIYLSNAKIEETKGDMESDFNMASDELTRSELCLRDQHPQRSPQLNNDIKTLPKEDQGNCIQVSLLEEIQARLILLEEIQARLINNDNQQPDAKRLRTDQPLPSSPESIQSDLTHPAHDLLNTQTPIDVHFAVKENASNEMISPNCSRRSMALKRPQQRYDDADMNKNTQIENRMSFFFVMAYFLCFILISMSIKLAIHQSS